jgi:hypothetical protein
VIPYARLSPGRGGLPKQAAFYYAQRLAVLPAARRAISRMLAAWVNRGQGEAPRPPADGYSARVLGELEQDGVSMLAPLASKRTIAGMVDYFLQNRVIGPDGPAWLQDLPAGVASAAYDLATVLECPGLVALINAASVLQVVTAYLGCKPTLSSLGVRWSFPSTGERPMFQSFHRDVDDWRFLKLFIYLTDVDEDSGPHTYVRTSHLDGFAVRAEDYKLEQLAETYGADKIATITGPRGTTFIADTLGIHRGGVVRAKPRLILQAQYSILPVYSFQYSPVSTAAPPVDRYINRLLLNPTIETLAAAAAPPIAR